MVLTVLSLDALPGSPASCGQIHCPEPHTPQAQLIISGMSPCLLVVTWPRASAPFHLACMGLFHPVFT